MRESVAKFDPPIANDNDPRLPVIQNLFKALGYSHIDTHINFDEQVAGDYIVKLSNAMTQMQSYQALRRILNGDPAIYANNALARLPAYLLNVGERELDRNLGKLTKQITKGAYLAETGRFLEPSDKKHYDRAKDQLLPAVAEQVVAVPVRRDFTEVAKYVAQFSPQKIAEVHGMLAFSLNIRDAMIESHARSSLVERGLVSHRTQDDKDNQSLRTALVTDFDKGRLWPQDFVGGQVNVLELFSEALGIKRIQSPDEFAMMLEQELEKRRSATVKLE